MSVDDDIALLTERYDDLRMLRIDLLSDLVANRIQMDSILLAIRRIDDEEPCQSKESA